MAQPPSKVMQAFGITAQPVPIDDGRGLCFRAGDIVLKPSDNDEESEWVGRLCESIAALKCREYRTSRPIQSLHSEHYVVDGWTAWTWISGKAAPERRLGAAFKACRSFHADLAKICPHKPSFLATRQNRWVEADQVTWEDKTLSQVPKVNNEILSLVQPHLDRLLELRKPLRPDLKSQLIHGDLTGNTLFDDDPDSPPGIIDMTLYWRPATYAEAIIVADGLAWYGHGRELIELYGTDAVRLQLLVRALYWRCLTFAIDSDIAWVREKWPHAEYGRAVELLGGLVQSLI